MKHVENVRESIRKHASKSIIRLSIGVLLIMYSLIRMGNDQPLFRRHTRDKPLPNNTGGAYHAALEADENRNPHYFLIGIGVVFLLLALNHLDSMQKLKDQLKKQ